MKSVLPFVLVLLALLCAACTASVSPSEALDGEAPANVPKISELSEHSISGLPRAPEEGVPVSAGALTVYTALVSGTAEECVFYRLELPQPAEQTHGTERIRAYYEAVALRLAMLAQEELLLAAHEKNSAVDLSATFKVLRNGSGMISVLREVMITALADAEPEIRTVDSETFHLETGELMKAEDFFAVDEAAYTARLLACVRAQIDEEGRAERLLAGWEETLRTSFSSAQFAVTDEAYLVYYQPGTLDTGAALFEIPWDALRDILK